MPPGSGRLHRALRRLRTIRVRLTLWYVALLAVILLAFSAFLYLSLERSLRSELDQSLVTTAGQVTATLDNVDGRLGIGGDAPDTLPSGTMVVLYDRTGQQVLALDPRQPLAGLPSVLARAAQAGGERFDTLRLVDGSQWRVYTTPVTDNGAPLAVLQVARSDQEVAHSSADWRGGPWTSTPLRVHRRRGRSSGSDVRWHAGPP
jgi:membrane protein implicated in regulation of membrane protease activity